MILKSIRLFLGSPEDIMQNQINILSENINALNEQIQSLKNQIILLSPTNLDFPKPLGSVNYAQVFGLLSNISEEVHVSDSIFSTTSVSEAEKFVKETKVNMDKYIAEGHDCDNFSYALEGYWSKGLLSYPFGIAWTDSHAFNVFIDDQNKIWIVEPQSARFYAIETAQKIPLYQNIKVVMM